MASTKSCGTDGDHRRPAWKVINDYNLSITNKQMARGNRRKTIADAILDCAVHNAHSIDLRESIRKKRKAELIANT